MANNTSHNLAEPGIGMQIHNLLLNNVQLLANHQNKPPVEQLMMIDGSHLVKIPQSETKCTLLCQTVPYNTNLTVFL